VSGYSDRFVLKGAMLIAVWMPDAFRATRDLDLLGRGDASPDSAEVVLKELCGLAGEPDGPSVLRPSSSCSAGLNHRLTRNPRTLAGGDDPLRA
jgi:hypothetical protein